MRLGGHFSLILALIIVASTQRVHADRPNGVTAQTVRLPSGPTSLKGLGESFAPNLGTGTGNYSVPVELPPGFLQPHIGLQYMGGSGKGPVGLGWQLPVLNVFRATDKGAPNYDENDRFSVSGPGISDELTCVDDQHGLYRLKNEGTFILFKRDPVKDTWTLYFADGDWAVLGASDDARQTSRGRVYRWYVSSYYDHFNHDAQYSYLEDAGQVYLSSVRYQKITQTGEYLNRVDIHYENRDDAFTDYSRGDACTTRWRVHDIQASHGARLIRTYTLAYQNELLYSQLASVIMTGEAGKGALPTLSFQYVADSSDSGQFVQMRSLPPLEGLFDRSAELDDFNRDGLPDLVVGNAKSYRYYENLDGVSWAARPHELSHSPDVRLGSDGVVLVDIDGDGFRDLVHNQNNEFRYYPSGEFAFGQLVGFRDPVALHTQATGYNFTAASVRMTDLNLDGRIDLIWQKPGRDSQLVNQHDLLSEQPIPELPVDVDFSDPRLSLTDFNGDGQLDFVILDIGLTRSRVRVWYGLGHGEFTAENDLLGVPTGSPGEFYLEDVNHDGQADLIRISGSWVTYYLYDGQLSFTPERGSFYGLPSVSRTRRILFADMNGNGSRDIVWITIDGKLYYLDLRGEPFAGLLSRIDNGMGLVTTINYRSSADYAVDAKLDGDPWKHPMHASVPLIESITVTDSFDTLGFRKTESHTSYVYRDGYFDGKEREFRGFGQVRQIEDGDDTQETLITDTYLYVGRNADDGSDEEILKGKPYLQIRKTESGDILSTTESRWERRWMCQEALQGISRIILPRCNRYSDLDAAKDSLVAYAVQTDILQGAWEGTTTPRFTGSQMKYDAWGSPETVFNYGEVALVSAHQPGDPFDLSAANQALGADESVAVTKTFYDVDNWLIGLPYERTATDLDGTVRRHSRVYYDDLDALGMASRGKATREQAWLDVLPAANKWIDAKRTEYTSDGEPSAVVDANGHRLEYEYDATGRFVTVERLVLDAPATPLEFHADYDYAFGELTTTTDPNGVLSKAQYDSLGRVAKVIGPEDTWDRPLVSYSYEFGTVQHPVSTTITDRLVDRASGKTRRSYSYSDGTGQVRQTKTESEGAYGFVASNWLVHSSRGKEVKAYEPFASAYEGIEEPPANTPVKQTYYDALGRETHVYAPVTAQLGQTYALTQYLPLEIRTYDESETAGNRWQHPVITRLDGKGRVRELTKVNEVDGSEQDLTWRVKYDSEDEIVWIADPSWSLTPSSPTANQRAERSYGYDTLGRQLFVQDPNLGRIDFDYDLVGNLRTRRDPSGTVETSYDALNRVTGRTARKKPTGPPEATYTFHYDERDPNGGLPDARNLRGQLAWVEYPTGREYYSYDAYHRETDRAHVLWNPALSNFAQQSRDLFLEHNTYSADDHLTAIDMPGGMRVDLTLNARGLTESTRATFGGKSLTVFGGAVYDARGLLRSGNLGNGLRACRDYDERGQLTGTWVGKSASCPDSQSTSHDGVQNLRFTRGYGGRISQIGDLSKDLPSVPRFDASYAYDTVGQLVWSKDVSTEFKFRYDQVQNLIERKLVQGTTSDPTGIFTYGENGAGPSMLTSAGTEHYTYSASGELQQYNGYDLTFNVEGLLVSASKAGKVIQFHYDAWGARRIAIALDENGPTRIQRYLDNGYELLAQVQRSGKVELEERWLVSTAEEVAEIRRTDGIDIDAGLLDQLTAYADGQGTDVKPLEAEYMDLDGDGDSFDLDDLREARDAFTQQRKAGGTRDLVSYLHGDQVGGATHVTDSSGQLVAYQAFHPYGSLSGKKGETSALGFAGATEEVDGQLGLLHFGARYYAPGINRWISPDHALGEMPKNMLARVLESSLYNYAANDPVGRRDPSGMAATGLRANLSALREGFTDGLLQMGEDIAKAAFWQLVQAFAGPWAIAIKGMRMVYDLIKNIESMKEIITHLGETVGNIKEWGKRILTNTGTAADYKLLGSLLLTAAVIAIGIGAKKVLGRLKAARAARGMGAPCGLCFAAGTLVMTSLASAAVPIEKLEVGDRVATVNDDGSATTRVDEETWRKLRLVVVSSEKADEVVEVETLRPVAWIEQLGLAPGMTLPLSIAELGVADGVATVLAIEPCPPIASGSGRVVLSKISHFEDRIMALHLTGAESALELTPNHRLYSAARHGWIAAQDLQAGEEVRTAHGTAKLVSSELLSVGVAQRVYNIEVETEHSYLVSDLEVLSHNADPCKMNADILRENLAREGRPVGPGQAAGHLVPSTGSQGRWAAGARSRDLLSKYGINVNDAANGVPIGHPRPHNLTHTKVFLNGVESRLKSVEQTMQQAGYGGKAIRTALRKELRAIGNAVQK